MERSISSTSKTYNLSPSLANGHSMFWWSLKITCATVLIAALFLKVIYQLNPWFNVPVLLAQGLVFIGAGSTLWHYLKLKNSTNNISQPQSLVQQFGLFKLIRHPMYLSDILVASGLFLLFPTIPTALVLAVGVFALVRQSQVEDAYLQTRFGEDFKRWQGKTKLILPYVY